MNCEYRKCEQPATVWIHYGCENGFPCGILAEVNGNKWIELETFSLTNEQINKDDMFVCEKCFDKVKI